MIFSKADKNKNGKLELEEFQEVVDDIIERYPQVGIYLKKKQMNNIMALMKKYEDKSGAVEVDIETFTSGLSEVDSQMKNLPATAQVRMLCHTALLFINA